MDQRFDLNGDEGIVKTIRVSGHGPPPRTHELVTCAYQGSLEDGTVFDSSESWQFELGTGNVIRGFDLGVASMRLGERAHFAIRFDYGYGETGLLNKVPPRATLYYEISLVAIEQRRAEDDVPALALPSSTGGGDGAGEEDASVTTVVVVDGEPVKLDKLGPVVINKDGTASRITNWQEMTPVEQQKTLRIISKRNKARIAAIIEQQRTEHTNDL